MRDLGQLRESKRDRDRDRGREREREGGEVESQLARGQGDPSLYEGVPLL